MFSLKASRLKTSRLGVAVWLLVLVTCLVLLQGYWMPAVWRAFLLCGVVIVSLLGLIYTHRRAKYITLNEQGAFLCQGEAYDPLIFVRANAIQLIAKRKRSVRVVDCVWPAYQVIYRDSLGAQEYAVLRSFAAQQILLGRHDNAKTSSYVDR
ncbi:hypothetical protein [Marinomonas algarum]|uniref:Uncharacterized protein n=1 Tax=Marinomonas algarum TaxID=2883105 RepID=A0A9X1LE64_9GAMM|nr:hypothetical protein [Marinomonas algarum]MCB5160963.1 hypothetical protein [Marinomonas algarum]